jgi:hypothetical protein
MLKIIIKISEHVSKINPQDYMTQDTVNFIIDVAKDIIGPF